MVSLASRLIPALPTVAGAKKRLEDPEAVRAKVRADLLRPARYSPPRRLDRTVDLGVHDVDGAAVYEVAPRGHPGTRRVLYLHGGAYVRQMSTWHWRFVAGLATAAGVRVTVPIYPLAPTGTADRVVPACAGIAVSLIEEAGAGAVTVMGDSAGGGLALAVVQSLRDRGLPAPAHTVLISPWLDVSMTDPALAALADADPFLAAPGLRVAGDLYRGDLPVDDPRVSPVHGDLTGLGPLTVFTGTRDILNADAHRLQEAASDAGVPLDVREEAGMIHVYPLLPTPEGRAARAVIADLVHC